MTNRSPLVWFGGKGNFLSKLLPLVPPHNTYVEPFAGGASLFFAKPPARIEVINDLDGNLIAFYKIAFYKVLRDPALYPELQRRLQLTLYSRKEHNDAWATWWNTDDPIERAARWYTALRMSFSGNFVDSRRGNEKSWSFGTTGSTSNVGSWLNAVDNLLPAAHTRLRQAQIECAGWRKILATYDGPETFFYCDPPYVASTRKSGGYAHEMTDDDHREFVAALQTLAGMVLVSGYACLIYEPLVRAGWERLDYETACHAAGRTKTTGLKGVGAALRMQPRTETLWLNPALQAALHRGQQLALPGMEP